MMDTVASVMEILEQAQVDPVSDPGASVQSDALTTAYDEELRDMRQSEELAKARGLGLRKRGQRNP